MKNHFRVSCALICAITILIASTAAVVLNAQTEKDDPALYCCDSTAISPAARRGTHSVHCDHEGSEECLYSCILGQNVCSSDECCMTAEEAEHFKSDYQNICKIDDPVLRDEKLTEFIAFYYGIPVDEVNLAEMRLASSILENDNTDIATLEKYRALSSIEDPEERNELFIHLLAEDSGLTEEEVRQKLQVFGESSGNGAKGFWDELFCEHSFLTGACENNHYGKNGCTVWCVRIGVCMNGCGKMTEINVQETEHTWSVGWCGQTCTVCGLVELFHQPGGCWYCS